MKKGSEYYLGLDIGTDSVGYAVTDAAYRLQKYKGEPMWGSLLFDAATGAAERRAYRTARRRIDRRQQRVQLLQELFAPEIARVDPNFFIRRQQSALQGADAAFGVRLFAGPGLTDEEYHRQYPTIHHLICQLMTGTQPQDIRLVYLACAWLVAHRGHFLYDIPNDNIEEILSSFEKVYQELTQYLDGLGQALPWCDKANAAQHLCKILQKDVGVREKADAIKEKLFDRKLDKTAQDERFPYSEEAVVRLLAGGAVKPADLFCREEYKEADSVSLEMDETEFLRIAAELGEDGELLTHLRAVHNGAKLLSIMHGEKLLSFAKVAVYEKHRADLRLLKRFVKKYCPQRYDEIFRVAKKGVPNYVSYTKNVKSVKPAQKSGKDWEDFKGCKKEDFCDYLRKELKKELDKVPPEPMDEADKKLWADMQAHLEAYTFLPKQRDADNRVIPQQLYRVELKRLLQQAAAYTPLLRQQDADGLTVQEKILSIFDFRVPYYVGPLKENGGRNTWLVRKASGRILPWNFDEKVDKDASERNFINRMTNTCTYLPGEKVLPEHSLLYERFKVLNELNNLKADGRPIPVQVKQELYEELYKNQARVSVKNIRDYLLQHRYLEDGAELSGLDETVKESLKTFHVFKRLLKNGALTQQDAEKIIERAAFTEEKARLRQWLQSEYPALPEEDVRYLLRQNLKGFGRLSRRFLTGLVGTEKGSDGEAFSLLEQLWNTNRNLMELLSDRYTYAEAIRQICSEYYGRNRRSLEDRLSEMYVPNAVKRPIYRTLEVVQEVMKAAGGPPTKIFVEMARGGAPEQKGVRTQSRKAQLLSLYKKVQDEDARELEKELEKMGVTAENRLQSRKLFLYYLQMGKSVYTGKHIALEHLEDGTYNLDHIYPQRFVKDDSLWNNLVLVESKENGRKSDVFPLAQEIRRQQHGFWQSLQKAGLMTEEKYRRLTRSTPFSPDEKWGFINRQLVETRQSTKAVAALLAERCPQAEIVYVKAGLVSEYRQTFDLLKCRTVNDLHHAKDAYLNIAVGNVYHERFTQKWFSTDSGDYNVQAKKLFAKPLFHGALCYWRGEEDQALVAQTVGKNTAHLTRYAFCRKGGLFDQQPVRKGENLVPLKKNMPTEKYGGYNKPTATFFALARYEGTKGKKQKAEVMLVPIPLLAAARFQAGGAAAEDCVREEIQKITGSLPQKVQLLLGGRPLKINTVFSFDGTRMTLSGKSGGGRQIIVSPLLTLKLDKKAEDYVKKLETFQNKQRENPKRELDEVRDGLSVEKNLQLYDLLVQKLSGKPYCNLPNNQTENLTKEEAKSNFVEAGTILQVNCLLSLLQWMNGKANTCDLTATGGVGKAGNTLLSSSLSNWAKRYSKVRIIDQSASGLFEHSSENLLALLQP